MASATKTPILQLPQWTASEKPERTDFNSAFLSLENAVPAKAPYVGNQGFSNKVCVVFGAAAHGGKYYSSMIPLLHANLYTITVSTIAVLNGGGANIGTTLVTDKNSLGFSVNNDNAGVAGQACFVNFTISK